MTLTWSELGHLVVLDEGPGIVPGEERRLFERFHRGRSDRPGTGLGLAIVELLAERWGGKAAIGNREGGGARAEVVLPLDSGRAGRRAADAGVRVTRLVALGLLGLAVAVAVGFGIHAVTRATIALPVVKLEQGASLAPPAARVDVSTAATTQTTTATTTQTTTRTTIRTTPAASAGTTGEDNSGSDSTRTTGEDNSGSGSSGSGRGRGRGRGGDDD